MEHVVFFPAPDGTPAFRRLADLDEAVRLVEHLRNVEGVSSASVHALTEVPLAFRAYYRVEVPSTSALPAQADAPSLDAAAEVAPLGVAPVGVAPVGVSLDGLSPVDLAPVEAAPVEPAPVELAVVGGAADGAADVPGVAAPAAEAAPALALVEDLPGESEQAPAMASSNGHATPTSLGFFA